MSFTATQYLFKATVSTATTTATVGAYTVPAATRGMVNALTISNTATTNVTAYADVSLWDGTTANPFLVKVPLYPGGSLAVESIVKQVMPTGGGIYLTAYATNVSAMMTVVEIT